MPFISKSLCGVVNSIASGSVSLSCDSWPFFRSMNEVIMDWPAGLGSDCLRGLPTGLFVDSCDEGTLEEPWVEAFVFPFPLSALSEDLVDSRFKAQ